MANDKGTFRTCEQGHSYYKKSDCPTCPTCEAERKPTEGFLVLLSAPARRALENEGITTLLQLAEYTEKEILKLHGIGPSAMPKLRNALEEEGLSFKK
ncbi:RNA polymerase alpha subunit C-terminal domain-containing protein [Paenibacillus sp. LS1]|uniref:RNA polymerase alpha subunit C-terminal domain-containing protein n=1 Tax=Paenibacillus sp. LS1 TaxID=2992120 RepID=UPI0022301C47|nr:RNA polymerase alpha subunit C-terminal domain-containing protein [Paenibacillus sp. LS1]MCW3792864.1 RNA polymerase alpha subunit C-terminal domain-containing protein [Paenibacillus sp. LS1]